MPEPASTRSSVIIAGLLAVLAAAPARAGDEPGLAAPAPHRPNIVFFLVDDLGWQDTSVPMTDAPTPLNRRYRTPAMERLAREGMTWTDAYATPVCSPSRISLMTGVNAARHRVTSWTLRRGAANDQRHPRLSFPNWNVNGLSPVEGIERTIHATPLPERLRAAGYHTIHIGKAHFAAMDTPGSDPTTLGFDVNIAGHAAGAPGSFYGEHHYASGRRRGRPDEPSVWDVPGLEAYHGTDVNLTEALTREAIRTLEDASRRDAPFFLYLSHYTVHTPIMLDPRFAVDDEELHPTEAAYASMVEAMDRSLGDVLAALDELGLAESTLVVFLSDNGGLSALGRGGPRDTHNLPLSCGKGSVREGGTRVPMLVRWPGVVPASTRTDTPMIIEDLFTTLVAAAHAGVGVDSAGAIDGRDLGPVLRDPAAPQDARPLVWHLPNMWAATGPGYGPASAIRFGDWKLIHYHDPEHRPRLELFDLASDPGETRNLAADRPWRTRTLAAALTRILRSRGAQWPRESDSDRTVETPLAIAESELDA